MSFPDQDAFSTSKGSVAVLKGPLVSVETIGNGRRLGLLVLIEGYGSYRRRKVSASSQMAPLTEVDAVDNILTLRCC